MASDNQSRNIFWSSIGLWLTRLLLIPTLILLGVSVWLSMTNSGTRAAFSALKFLSNGAFNANNVNGTLLGPLSIGKFVIENDQQAIDMEQVKLEWIASELAIGLLHLSKLRVENFKIRLKSDLDTKRNIPTSLNFPIRLKVDKFTIGNGHIEKNKKSILFFNGLAANLDFDHQFYSIKFKKLLLKIPNADQWNGQLDGDIKLYAVAPFITKAKLNLSAIKKSDDGSTLQAHSEFNVTGNLSDLQTKFDLNIEEKNKKSSSNGDVYFNLYSTEIFNKGKIHLYDIDLHNLHEKFPTTKINSDIQLDKNGSGKFFIKNNLSGTLDKNRLPLHDADGKFQFHHWELHLTESQINNGIIRANGNLTSDYVRLIFTSHGTDLRKIDSRFAKTALHARLDVEGVINPVPEALLKFHIEKSIINKHALSGKGIIKLNTQQIQINSLSLFAGDNALHARGILDKNSGDVKLELIAPDLAQLGENFHGNIRINAHIAGNIDKPFVNLQWDAHQLSLPGKFSIEKTKGSGKFDINWNSKFLLTHIDTHFFSENTKLGKISLGILNFYAKGNLNNNSDSNIKLDLLDINYDSHKIKNIILNVEGKIADHKITASILSASQKLYIEAEGKFNEINAFQRWNANLKKFEASGYISAQLKNDAHLAFSKNFIKIDSFYIDSNFGNFYIDYFKRDKKIISSQGKLKYANLSKFSKLFILKKLIKKTDLLIDGNWNFQTDENFIEPPSGSLSFQRNSGDIVFQGEKPFSAGLQKLNIALKSERQHLAAKIEAEGKYLGTVSLNAVTIFQNEKNFLDLKTPLNGKIDVAMPSIAWVGPIISSDLIIDGSLNAALIISGSLQDPYFDGNINGDQFHVMFLDTGVNLMNGMLDCELSGNTVKIKQLKFSDKRGSAIVSGPVNIQNGKTDADLMWRADKFTIFDSSDRKLTFSGSGKIITLEDKLHVGGDVLIDHGFLDIGRTDTPILSDDVIISGQQKKTALTQPLALDIGIGLGEQLTLRGRGLNARIGGALRLQTKANGSLSVFGLMQIIKGTYQAYGRELAIERGNLRFDGSVANPAIDIRAIRRGTEVEAGVAIGGNAMAPRISLVSEPEVPDAEKLSWLVLGQGLYSASGAQAGTLQNAATSLLSQSAVAGVQSQIATALGLDTISVSKSQGTLQERIVTLGKRVSSRLYVSFQQGLQTASSVVLFRYTLSSRLAVEAETGNRSVFSLFYNITFD